MIGPTYFTQMDQDNGMNQCGDSCEDNQAD